MFKEETKWWKVIGSAILISIACIDPGNLQGDIQVSQAMGYKSIWVLFFSHIMLYFFQEMSIIIGCQSSQDLGKQISLSYKKHTAYFIWFSAELAIIAADVQEILGASIALQLLFNISNLASLPVVIAIVLFVLYIQQIGQQLMEFIFLIFVFLMALCFMANFVMLSPNWINILKGFIPSIPNSLEFTAVVGAIIMPQNLFLQSSLVLTRNHLNVPLKRLIKLLKIETAIILVLSFFINFFLVSVFADPYYADKDIDLSNAGESLQKFLPKISASFWAIGLLCAGISSTATGALTGQYLMEGIFNMKISKLKRILITRLITIIPCALIMYFCDVNQIINLLNIVQFVELPFVIIPLIRFVSSRGIMGHRCYSRRKICLVIFLSGLLQAINLYSLHDAVGGGSLEMNVIFGVLVALQTLILAYISFTPIIEFRTFGEGENEDYHVHKITY
jgi:NRAMP (natural resistance-associated macrophage protein)-like metal ion transporter